MRSQLKLIPVHRSKIAASGQERNHRNGSDRVNYSVREITERTYALAPAASRVIRQVVYIASLRKHAK